MLLCFQILSTRKKSRKSQERKCKRNAPLSFSLVTNYKSSHLKKVIIFFKSLPVPVVCVGCRRYICVYFTCLSVFRSALLSLFTTLGGKLLFLSMLGTKRWQRIIWLQSVMIVVFKVVMFIEMVVMEEVTGRSPWCPTRLARGSNVFEP